MIYLYTGTPGSGKSFHALQDAIFKLQHGGNVIANFPIKLDGLKAAPSYKLGKFIYLNNYQLTVPFLIQFAKKNHIKGKEGQTLIIIDESQAKFNCRDFGAKDRVIWNEFMSMHRHLGYNMILITQHNRLLDRQIRYKVEYDVIHRCVNNFKLIGKLLPFKMFAGISRWFGNNEKIGTEMIRFSKKKAERYDSYAMFDVLEEVSSGVGGQGVPDTGMTFQTIRDDFIPAMSWSFLLLPPKLYKTLKFIKANIPKLTN